MISSKRFHLASLKTLLGIFLLVLFVVSPAYSVDTQDSQIFVAGFNAYLKKNYPSAISNMSEVLQKYPDTPLRDMALFWLANAHYKAGHSQAAGQYMAQFFKEYPSSSLKGTVDEKLAELAGKYQRGEPITGSTMDPAPVAAGAPTAAQGAATPLPAAPLTVTVSEAGKQAGEKTEQAKQVIARAEAEKLAREQSEQERERSVKAETDRAGREKAAAEKATAVRGERVESPVQGASASALREKAIAEYKRVIDTYPGTRAAAGAAAKLKSLGVAYAAPSAPAPAVAAAVNDNSRTLSVEVDQAADLELLVTAESQLVEAGSRFNLPFELVNRGNFPDSFVFEAAFPVEYRARFMAASSPEQPLGKTAKLMPGERFKGLLQLEMPSAAIDGERKLLSIRAFSEADTTASQSRAIRLTAQAPIMRALIKTDSTQVKPGEQVAYRLVVLNVGSAAAKDLTLRITHPPQYEPINAAATGLAAEGSGTLLLSGLRLSPGERREIDVTMQLKSGALALEELFLRADLVNAVLNRTDSFVSSPVAVKAVGGVSVHATAEKITVVPGQTVTVPLAVTNTGNMRDRFSITATFPGKLHYSFYLDSNQDGIRQANEPQTDSIGPLSPRESAHLLLTIASESTEKDGVNVPLAFVFASESAATVQAATKFSLAYSRPVLNLQIVSKGGKVKPGEVSSFELSCVNVGSSMAKVVDVRSTLPEQLEVVASEPLVTRNAQGDYLWSFVELGAGEQRSIRVSYRIKPGTPVGTSLALKNILTYQDQVGNSY